MKGELSPTLTTPSRQGPIGAWTYKDMTLAELGIKLDACVIS